MCKYLTFHLHLSECIPILEIQPSCNTNRTMYCHVSKLPEPSAFSTVSIYLHRHVYIHRAAHKKPSAHHVIFRQERPYLSLSSGKENPFVIKELRRSWLNGAGGGWSVWMGGGGERPCSCHEDMREREREREGGWRSFVKWRRRGLAKQESQRRKMAKM